MAAAGGLVLARREHRAALAMVERRVVDVLADVVLVHPHGRIRREREVLQMHQVDAHRCRGRFSTATCQNQAGAAAARRNATR